MPHWPDATALAGLVAWGAASPYELLDAALARVAALNTKYKHHGATAVMERALSDADLRERLEVLPHQVRAGIVLLLPIFMHFLHFFNRMHCLQS